jgi:hypothetical protein
MIGVAYVNSVATPILLCVLSIQEGALSPWLHAEQPVTGLHRYCPFTQWNNLTLQQTYNACNEVISASLPLSVFLLTHCYFTVCDLVEVLKAVKTTVKRQTQMDYMYFPNIFFSKTDFHLLQKQSCNYKATHTTDIMEETKIIFVCI